MQIFPSLNCIMLLFLPRGPFVTETFCSGDVLLQEAFCYGDVLYGDVLSRRRFVCAPNTVKMCQLTFGVSSGSSR
jgi:hypothetical protein